MGISAVESHKESCYAKITLSMRETTNSLCKQCQTEGSRRTETSTNNNPDSTDAWCVFLCATAKPQPKDGVERNGKVTQIRSGYNTGECYDRADLASYDQIASGISPE
ncbi:hypothetical protein PV325_011912 [Microctonus aethiopoides]|nr:hypothetical protein PV325_011912 [Microctonus aethiopoides]KAK0077759.1 hypothetical protein PV326_009846 [Microctonus aethiopoides]